MTKMIINEKPFPVGPVLVQRVPSSSVRYRLKHEHSWHGYLCPWKISSKWLTKFGKLIEVRTINEFNAECLAYRAQMQPGQETRLAYYEVIDAGSA